MFTAHEIAASGGRIVELSTAEQAGICGGDIWDKIIGAVVTYVVSHSDELVDGFIDGFQDGYAG